MSEVQAARSGTRFPLLVSMSVFDMLRWPALLLGSCSYIVWVSIAQMPLFAEHVSLLGFVVGALTLVALFSLVAPRLSYVQCCPKYLLVRGPLYRLAVSYRRINSVSLADFSDFYLISEQSWGARRFLTHLFQRSSAKRITVIRIELTSLPFSYIWLRLWFNRYLFTVDENGMLLVVRDWMLLKREIDLYRTLFRERVARGDISYQ